MIYSVWNSRGRHYEYFETNEVSPTHAPPPKHVQGRGLGATPDEAGWPLPHGARSIGTGELPRGRIASTGLSGTPSSSAPMLAIGVGLYVLWTLRGRFS